MTVTHPEITPHAWTERRNLHPWDIRLRERGFHILARPERGPTTWTRDHVTYTEAAAMAIYLAETGSCTTTTANRNISGMIRD